MRFISILAVALSLSGCWQSQSRASSSFDVHGTLNGQPVTLHIDGDSATVAKAGLDPAAIQAAVAAGVEGIKAQIPGVAQIEAIMKAALPKNDGLDPGAAAGAVGTAGALALAIAQMLAARSHKKDADEGWEKANKYALLVPPEKASA